MVEAVLGLGVAFELDRSFKAWMPQRPALLPHCPVTLFPAPLLFCRDRFVSRLFAGNRE
jgi:hypothetical protein